MRLVFRLKALFLSLPTAALCFAAVLVLTGQAAETTAKPKTGADLSFSADFKNSPTYIKSRTLKLEAKERVFTYSEEVVVTQGDLLLTADKVVGRYSAVNEIESLTATGHVVIEKGTELKASSARADYAAATETLILTESPEIMQGVNILTADKITIFLLEDRSLAEGTVRVKVSKDLQSLAE